MSLTDCFLRLVSFFPFLMHPVDGDNTSWLLAVAASSDWNLFLSERQPPEPSTARALGGWVLT